MLRNMQIKKLPIRVSEAIKSGESIIDLVSVCRELLENGIDAKASLISLEIKLDCKTNMINVKCSDNGVGISKLELSVLGERYYTSKLTDDLTAVKTLGFRGEALNSIMSISNKCVIISRVAQFNGGFEVISINGEKLGGVISHFNPFEVGTTVKINGLFDNVKVRKDIILNESVIKLVNNLKMMILKSTLEYRGVKIDVKVMKLAVNGNCITKRFACNGLENKFGKLQSQMEVLQDLFGDISKEYEVVKVQFEDLKLEMCIGVSISQTKQFQIMFLNGRPFENPSVRSAVNKRYQQGYGYRDHGDFKMFGKPFSTNAVFIANFEAAAGVDVNDLIQTPSKVCVETPRERVMVKLFEKAIDLFFKIQKKSKVPDETANGEINHTTTRKLLKSNMRVSNFEKIQPVDASIDTKHQVLNMSRFEDELAGDGCSHMHHSQSSQDDRVSHHFGQYSEVEVTRESFKEMEVIGQCDDKYIIVKLGDSILAIDQHGCDERVRVEQKYHEIQQDAMSGDHRGGQLDPPIVIEMSRHEQELAHEYAADLAKWGIQIANGRLVTHLPPLLRGRPVSVIKAGVCEYLFNLTEGTKRTLVGAKKAKVIENAPQMIQEGAKIWACRGAVMFGEKLTRQRCQEMICALSSCHSPHFCAHGRVIFIVLKTSS